MLIILCLFRTFAKRFFMMALNTLHVNETRLLMILKCDTMWKHLCMANGLSRLYGVKRIKNYAFYLLGNEI